MFVQIKKNMDGSHAFQYGGILSSGWAVVPENIEIPDTFPFVNIEVAEITHPAVTVMNSKIVDDELVDEIIILEPEYTQLEVISMTEGEEIIIEELELEPEPTAQDDTDAMLIDHEYRLTLLELGLTN